MNNLLDIPFDQYSRQKIVADLINAVRTTREEFTVIDVGGYKGKTSIFLPNDSTTVLDIHNVNDKDYIKGDGTSIDLEDGSYDFVVSFDVLEHIKKEDRSKFIKECSRISRKGFFLCFPFETGHGKTQQAEINLNNIYKAINGEGHKWLEEHIANKLPEIPRIETIIKETNLAYCRLFSNKLDDWIALQTAFFLSTLLKGPSIEAGLLNRYYNQNMNTLESGANQNNSYRVIYFMSKDNKLVEEVKNSMEAINTGKNTKYNGGSVTEKLPIAIAEILSLNKKEFKEELQHMKAGKIYQEKEINSLRKTIKEIENSMSWKVTKPLRYMSRKVRR